MLADPRWQVPLAALVRQAALAPAQAVFVVDEHGRSLTYREFARLCDEVATSLARLGVRARMRVAWQLPTWIEAFVLTGALSLLETVQIPLPYGYREHELASAIRETEASVLIAPTSWRARDHAAMTRAVAQQSPGTRCLTMDRSPLDSAAWFSEDHEPIRLVSPAAAFDDDVRWVFFTSGTSSRPKAVLHTDRSVTVPSTTMADRFLLTSHDRAAIAFPLGHIGGVNWLVAALQTHCMLLLSERFDGDAVAFFDDQNVTLPGVSTVFHLAYLNYARSRPSGTCFGRVRAFPGGAATKPPSLQYALRREIGGVGIVSGFGLTECPMISMSAVSDPESKLAHTEGRLSPGVEVEIRDLASPQVRPPGLDGEISVRGPQLFRGYADAEMSRTAFDDDGYFRTGDVGHFDAEDYLTITGRLKDVIIRKGENISAKEIEDHLYSHPAVADAAVVGLPDVATGERCCAVVVIEHGHGALTLRSIADHLRHWGVTPYKWPEQLEVVDALPRGASGKILKNQLIAALGGSSVPQPNTYREN